MVYLKDHAVRHNNALDIIRWSIDQVRHVDKGTTAKDTTADTCLMAGLDLHGLDIAEIIMYVEEFFQTDYHEEFNQIESCDMTIRILHQHLMESISDAQDISTSDVYGSEIPNEQMIASSEDVASTVEEPVVKKTTRKKAVTKADVKPKETKAKTTKAKTTKKKETTVEESQDAVTESEA